MMENKLLIIDDDASVRSSLTLLLKRAKFEVESVSSPEAALAFIREQRPSLILMDMNFTLATSGEEGIRLLRQVKVFHPDIPVLLMTAWGSISLAVEGMRAGAFDFITKPWNNMALLNTIRTALEVNQQQEKRPFERSLSTTKPGFEKIIGQSPTLMDLLGTVERIASTQASVLITGESGTGKELIAEALHLNSNRNKAPFVKVNLGGLSQSLFESEMFGHKKGAFTDACTDRIGRFELADKGTIFLDEIGDLDPACQVKLLRVLQDKTYEVLGDSRPRKTDVRVVSATNCNLPEKVADRSFREDLFYRINLITIHLPALRERKEDIPLLVNYFAEMQCRENGLQPVEFTSDAYSYLQQQAFPGNIRELKNLVERTLLVSTKSRLTADDFRSQIQTSIAASDRSANTNGLTLDELEKQKIQQTLLLYSGNLSRVAAALGISRAALYRRLEKYNLHIDK